MPHQAQTQSRGNNGVSKAGKFRTASFARRTGLQQLRHADRRGANARRGPSSTRRRNHAVRHGGHLRESRTVGGDAGQGARRIGVTKSYSRANSAWRWATDRTRLAARAGTSWRRAKRVSNASALTISICTRFISPTRRRPRRKRSPPLDTLVRSGKVRYIGSSNYAGWQVADAAWIAKARGWAPYVSAQNHYNLLNRAVEQDLLPACRHFGVGILPFFPLASGFLTGKYRRGEEPAAGHALCRDAPSRRSADDRG